MSKFLLRYLFKSRVIVKLETMSRHHRAHYQPPQGVSSNTTVSLNTLGETVSVIGDVSRPLYQAAGSALHPTIMVRFLLNTT